MDIVMYDSQFSFLFVFVIAVWTNGLLFNVGQSIIYVWNVYYVANVLYIM